MSDVYGVLADHADRNIELARRIGYAKGSIEEALLLIDNYREIKQADAYWAKKSLRRALSVLTGESYAGEVQR